MFTSVVSGRPEQRKCARNFLRYCDADDNLKISREEWVECLKLEGGWELRGSCVLFGSTINLVEPVNRYDGFSVKEGGIACCELSRFLEPASCSVAESEGGVSAETRSEKGSNPLLVYLSPD